MTRDEPFPDDPVLRRVAAVRPEIPEADLSPSSERACAIVDRVMQSEPHPSAARRSDRPRWFRRAGRRPVVFGVFGFAAAAACAALVIFAIAPGSSGTGDQASAEVLQFNVTSTPPLKSWVRKMSRTPLGAAMAQGLKATQQNISTGGPGQNEEVIVQLAANIRAGEKAIAAVEHAHAEPKQRRLQRTWVEGEQFQIAGDKKLIAALRATDNGDTKTGKRLANQASNAYNVGDGLTGWAENGILGNPGPRPRGH